MLSPDLPGHGVNSLQHGVSVYQMVEAVAALCARDEAQRALVVGHSMGGMVALELAHRYPDLVQALVLIDSVIFPPAPLRTAIASLAEGMQKANPTATLDEAAAALFEAADDPSVKARYRQSLGAIPVSVLREAFKAHLIDYDPVPIAIMCELPIAYVGAQRPLGDLNEIRSKIPNIRIGQVLGSGHFAPLLVPNQINSMIAGFIKAIGIE